MRIKETHWIHFILTGVIMILMSGNVQAQNTDVSNLMNRAEELRKERKFSEAAEILAQCNQQHPDNIGVVILYGQTLTQMEEFGKAQAVFKEALKFHPDNPDLLKATKKLHHEAPHIASPKLQIAGSYRSDSQPLKAYGTHAVFQYYISNLLQLSLSGGINHYTGSSYSNNISYFKIEDVLESPKGKTTVGLSLGMLYSEGNKTAEWSGDLQLKQALFKNIWLEGEASRHNYVYTLPAVLNLLMYHTYKLELTWGNAAKWNGITGSSLDVFGDNNSIITYTASVQSKPVKIDHLSLAFGYNFTYMNSKQDRFRSLLSASDLLAMAPAPNTVTPIVGIYGAYYTPLQQFSNALTTNISYQMSGITWNGNLSVGVYAKTNAPSLTMSTENNSFRILKAYNLKNFVPIDLVTSLLMPVGKRWQLEVNYTFTRTYFYDSHNLAAWVKYSF